MTRTRVLPVLVLVVAAGALAALSAPATAAYPNSENVCTAVGESQQSAFVIVFPTGDTVVGDTRIAMYPGTEFRLFLCDNDGGDRVPVRAWEQKAGGFPSQPGFSVVATNTDQNYLQVRVTEGEDATREISVEPADIHQLPSNIDNVAPGPTISIARGNVVPARYSFGDASVDQLVYFEDGEKATAFDERRRAFHANLDELDAAVAAVNDSGGNASAVSPATIRRLGRTTPEGTGYAGVREALAPAAVAGTPGATTALAGYTRIQREAFRTAEWALEAQQKALREEAERNARSVLVNLLGTAVLGLLLGAAVGWYLTKRRVDEVAYQRVRTSSVDFDLSLLRAPVGAALVLALVSVALVVATGLLGPFIRVLLAVLP